MSIIQIDQLSKSYRVYQKKEGLREALRGLWHREYKEVKAVKDISLRVEPGEFVAFLGPNGAGKTTTLKLLSGVIYPTNGSATVMGFVPWERSLEYRRRFALVMGKRICFGGICRHKSRFDFTNRFTKLTPLRL